MNEEPESHLLLVEGATTERAGRAGAREEEDAKTFGFFLIAIAVVVGTCAVALLGNCAAARRGCIAIGSECALRVRLISKGVDQVKGMKQRTESRDEKQKERDRKKKLV